MLDQKGKRIILASQSPRRQQLMKGLDIDFEIEVREVEEIYPDDMPAVEIPSYLAKLKSEAFDADIDDNTIVVTSDTIVIHEGKVLEKPKSREEAVEMISRLSDSTHTVVTAVCLSSTEGKVIFDDHTKVSFVKISDEEVGYYIDRYRPYDKAGAYGVQEWLGYIGIDRLEGSYFTVMGFPLHKVYAELKKLL